MKRNRVFLLCIIVLALLLVACSLIPELDMDRRRYQGTPTPQPTLVTGREHQNQQWRER